MNKTLVYVGILVAIVIAIGGYMFPSSVNTVVERTVGTFASPTIYEALELLGGVTVGKVNSTSTTATSQTLSYKDIVGFDTVVITPNTGDLTLTFPASSTMPHFLPKVGQRMQQCWYNASTTAGIDITFAAGTGIDLEVASSTVSDGTPVLTLLADSKGCFEFMRKPLTATAYDFSVTYFRGVDGD